MVTKSNFPIPICDLEINEIKGGVPKNVIDYRKDFKLSLSFFLLITACKSKLEQCTFF